MDSLVFAIGIGVMAGLSIHAGRRWAQSTLQALLWGPIAATAGATAGLALATAIALHDEKLDLPAVGLELAILLGGGSIVAAVLALGAHRRARRAELNVPSDLIERRLKRVAGSAMWITGSPSTR